MWSFLAKATLSSLPKDKLLFSIIFIPLGLILFIGLFFAGPGTIQKHVPLAEDAQYRFYMNAASQIQSETTIEVDYQQIMAIDAVLLKQDFTYSSQDRAYSYKKYFVREQQEQISCPYEPSAPSPTASTTPGTIVGTKNISKTVSTTSASSKTCYKTVYYGRTFDEVLQMLVADHVITKDQIEDIKDYVKFKIVLHDFHDDDEEEDTGGLVVEGDSDLKETVFAWPLPKGNKRITSPFGMRTHPVTGIRTGHKGVDLGASTGTDIYSIADGTVTFVGGIGNGGNAVYINHGSGIISKYMHMSGFGVTEGQSVSKGQLIGWAGATGRVTGPHLHLQIEVRGTPVNPMRYY